MFRFMVCVFIAAVLYCAIDVAQEEARQSKAPKVVGGITQPSGVGAGEWYIDRGDVIVDAFDAGLEPAGAFVEGEIVKRYERFGDTHDLTISMVPMVFSTHDGNHLVIHTRVLFLVHGERRPKKAVK